MKILVTGGAGYIGSHTCKALAAAGHNVVVYDNLSSGHREFAKFGEFEHGDIRDTQYLKDCLVRHKPEGVIHFAASSDVGESVRDPGKYFSNNVSGTLSLLQAMRDSHITNIVVSGTCSVYGQPEQMPISENCALQPINPYGATKLFMERMLADFHTAHNFNWTSLRYFNAAGNSPDGDIGEWHIPETHLVPRVIFAALGKIDVIEIFGNDYPTPDGSCIRDYIHVDDLAKAHILAMEKLVKGGASKAYNLGTGHGTSVFEIISGVNKISGKTVPVRIAPGRQGDTAQLVADAGLAARELGWRPEKNLETMLNDAWNFFVKRKF